MEEASLPNIPPGVKREAMRWYQKSVETDKAYGLSKKVFVTCDALKRMWRNAHPQTVSFWYDIEEAVKQAIHSPGIGVVFATLLREQRIGQITYMGTNPYSRKWERLNTYGGKIIENICQSTARDVLAYNMPTIEKAGYEIVLTVHDEIISEAPDTPEFSAEGLSKLLSFNPDWAFDLPLSANGFETYRYRKE
ncbi:DNA polymerase I [Aphis craccivora]|uniref:DNA polymerase I n=1 Tax=Aphis craccivora TaxID=307492 RepID=A0A6G0YF50_APHCR|nr:DNA polymerase I [Aphis craccivora]